MRDHAKWDPNRSLLLVVGSIPTWPTNSLKHLRRLSTQPAAQLQFGLIAEHARRDPLRLAEGASLDVPLILPALKGFELLAGSRRTGAVCVRSRGLPSSCASPG